MDIGSFIAKYGFDSAVEPELSSEQQPKRDDSHACPRRTAYLHTVVQGKHVIGRDFAYISGTVYNRKCFIRIAKRALYSCEPMGPLSIGDIQSILQLICPNFPLGVVKNAFTPARRLTAVQASTTTAAASPALYWRCLQATLMFEAHLMEIRKACFDKDKSCKDVKTLRQRLGRVSVACKQLRIPEEHLQQAISAMDGGQCTFGDLLRNLCENDDLHHQLVKELSRADLPSWSSMMQVQNEEAETT